PRVEAIHRIHRLDRRTLRVELTLRQPVLALCWEDRWRLVDAKGIWWTAPRSPPLARGESGESGGSAPPRHIPMFKGNFNPPAGSGGTAWGDPVIAAAAKFAASK